MNTLELSDAEREELETVLRKNAAADSPTDAVWWEDESRSRIAALLDRVEA